MDFFVVINCNKKTGYWNVAKFFNNQLDAEVYKQKWQEILPECEWHIAQVLK